MLTTNRFVYKSRMSSFTRFLNLGTDLLLLLLTLALIGSLLWSQSGLAANASLREVDYSAIQSGSLLFQLPDQIGVFAAPTVHTDVQVSVSGNIASVEIAQEFYNPTEQFIEGLYAFPLSDNAAIFAMRLQVDGRVIEGQIQEKAEAKKTYEKAKQDGKRAGLLQQSRPNLFSTQIANIGGGETVYVVLRYQQYIPFQQTSYDAYYELRIPTAITPRYTPRNSPDPVQAVSNTTRFSLGELSAMQANNALDTAATGGKNSLNIATRISADQVIRDIQSPSHPIVVSGPLNDQYEVSFTEPQVASKDYVLRWYPNQTETVNVSLLKQFLDNQDYYLLSLMPPLQGSGSHALAREVIYIIDVSGSMEGESLRQAKKALALAISRLRAQDKFNVIKFSDDASALFPEPKQAGPDAIGQALNYVTALESEGGTEIASALKTAFAMKSSDGYTGQIIFLTDGAASNEQQLFALIEQQLGQRRLFTVGIGSAPNSYFMVKAAQFGRGVYTYISDSSEVQEKMSALFRQLENPALTDIELSMDEGELEFWPQRVPDLYLGQPLTLAFKAGHAGHLQIRGKQGDTTWQVSMGLADAVPGKGIARRWARTKIAALMDGLSLGETEDTVKAQVLPLALKHKLVSQYTSFVAVDVTPARYPGEDLKALPYKDNTPGDSVRLASTASTAPLQLLLGLALLLSALTLRSGVRVRVRAST